MIREKDVCMYSKRWKSEGSHSAMQAYRAYANGIVVFRGFWVQPPPKTNTLMLKQFKMHTNTPNFNANPQFQPPEFFMTTSLVRVDGYCPKEQVVYNVGALHGYMHAYVYFNDRMDNGRMSTTNVAVILCPRPQLAWLCSAIFGCPVVPLVKKIIIGSELLVCTV